MGSNIYIYHLGQLAGMGSDAANPENLSNNMPLSYFPNAQLTLYNYETNAEHNSESVIGRSGPILTYSSVKSTLKIAFTLNSLTNATDQNEVNATSDVNLTALEGLSNLLYPVYDNQYATRVIAPPLCELLVITTTAEGGKLQKMKNRRMIGYIKEFSYNLVKNQNVLVAVNSNSDGTQLVPTNFDVSINMDLLPDRTRGTYFSGNSLLPVEGTFMNPTDFKTRTLGIANADGSGLKPPRYGN